jgi:hypothetical protein
MDGRETASTRSARIPEATTIPAGAVYRAALSKGGWMRDNDKIIALQRWTAPGYPPRKDVPRTCQHLTDVELAEQFRRATQTIAILTRMDQKSFDSNPEALRARALSLEEYKELRKETLAAATRLRAELRRRVVSPGAGQK